MTRSPHCPREEALGGPVPNRRPGRHVGHQVAAVFDTWGSQRYYNDHGYWQGDYVDSGYWDEMWIDEGSYYDESGNYIEVGYNEPYWVDESYWVDEANWEPVVDIVRTYKKCRKFNRGRGRVAINFDTYSREYLSGARVAYKHPSNPAFMDIAAYFRQGGRLAGKDVPEPRTKAETPKPKARPSTPKPTVTRG